MQVWLRGGSRERRIFHMKFVSQRCILQIIWNSSAGRHIATLPSHFLYEVVGSGSKIRIVEESEAGSSGVGSKRGSSVREVTLLFIVRRRSTDIELCKIFTLFHRGFECEWFQFKIDSLYLNFDTWHTKNLCFYACLCHLAKISKLYQPICHTSEQYVSVVRLDQVHSVQKIQRSP